MENATKALLIAAAILVAIVIISIGMVVLNQGQSTTQEAGQAMSEAETTKFNAQFKAYIGNSVDGGQLKELIKKVKTSNADENNSGDNRFVTVIVTDETGASPQTYGCAGGPYADITIPTNLSKSDLYRVTITDETNNGTILEITAKKK